LAKDFGKMLVQPPDRRKLQRMQPMKLLFSLLALFLLTLVPVKEDEKSAKPNTLTPKEIADGWILLFDGESTFGWKIDGDARVEDGRLVIGGDKPSKATITSMYRDWELYLDSVGEGQLTLITGDGNKISAGLANQTLKLWATGGGMAGAGIEVKSGAVNQATFTYDGLKPVQMTVQTAAGKWLAISNVKLKPLGLKSIFNGKDLTGWKVIPGHKSEFAVNDKGELTIKNGNGDIQTEGEWDDFVLQLEIYSNGPHLNSGVFFRCIPGQFWSGYEAQIRNEWVSDVELKDGTKLTGSLTVKGDDAKLQVYKVEGKGAHGTKEVKKFAKADIAKITDHRDMPIDFGTGAIYNCQAARKVVSNDYEWYTMTVVANGNHLAVWVNGYQTADFTDTRPPNKSARKGSKVEKGPISLQGHDPTTDLSFRNIRIAELPKAAVAGK
jgi:hypothetical protein